MHYEASLKMQDGRSEVYEQEWKPKYEQGLANRSISSLFRKKAGTIPLPARNIVKSVVIIELDN
jgi:hypothetical protein